jgi:hypothetical protein
MSGFFPEGLEKVGLQVMGAISCALIFTYNDVFTSDDTTSVSLKQNSQSLAQEMMPMILFLTILPAGFGYGSPCTRFLSPILIAVVAAAGVDIVARHTEDTLSQHERMGLAIFGVLVLEFMQLAINAIWAQAEGLAARIDSSQEEADPAVRIGSGGPGQSHT